MNKISINRIKRLIAMDDPQGHYRLLKTSIITILLDDSERCKKFLKEIHGQNLRDVLMISESEGKLRFDNGVEILIISNESQIIDLTIFHACIRKDCSYIDRIRRRIISRFGDNENTIEVYENKTC